MRFAPLVALTLAGCATPCATVPANDLASAGDFLRGLVSAPKAWVAPASGDAPATARAQVPAPRAGVTLADAAGNPIAGLYRGQADANGAYGMYKLPPGYTFVVQAQVRLPDGNFATLETLGHPGTDPNQAVPVDLATTLVTLAATDGLTGLAGDVDPAIFDAAVKAVRTHLADQDPPAEQANASLGYDRGAAIATVQQMAKNDPTLQTDLDQLHGAAASPRTTEAQLDTDVAKNQDQDPLSALVPVY